MNLFNRKNTLKEYRRLRKESRAVVEKIATLATKHNLIAQAAKSLGMLEGKNTIVMNSESDTSYLMDYVLFEAKIGTQTTLEYFYDYGPELTPKEDDYLAAMLENYVSVFEIVDFDAANATVFLIDLLHQNRPVTIIDAALSQNKGLLGVVLFSRIFTFEELSMRSGASMTFFPQDKTDLLNRLALLKFKNRGKLSSGQMYQFFYKIHCSIGVETRFEE